MLATGNMPRPRLTPLLALELVALLAFIGLSLGFVVSHGSDSSLVPLDVDALATGPSRERWMGIFFDDQKVGYAVNRSAPVAGGGTLHEGRSHFRLAAFGTIQDVITAQAALTDADGALQRFDFFMVSDQVRISARGEVRGSEIVMEVDTGGGTQSFTFPVSRPPHVELSLEEVVRRQELSIGARFEVPYFNPATMSEGVMEYEVTDVEVLENGEEAWWVDTRFGDVQARELVTSAGDVIRQESPLGMSMVRMTADEAQAMPASDQAVDIIAKSAVQLTGKLDRARGLRVVELAIQGVAPERIVDDPPVQTRTDGKVRVEMPLLAELPRPPVVPAAGTEVPAEWLESSPTIQADHPDILQKAEEITAGASDRIDAAVKLEEWVFHYVDKVPTFGVPSGLEVLRTAQGDCNEHTALYVSLARSLGIPTRIAAGVVYSDRVGDRGAFYYHAWPEVWIGDGRTPDGEASAWGWLPVDPTFGQAPADATHVKLVEGDLDRQVEILAVMGRLSFVALDAR